MPGFHQFKRHIQKSAQKLGVSQHAQQLNARNTPVLQKQVGDFFAEVATKATQKDSQEAWDAVENILKIVANNTDNQKYARELEVLNNDIHAKRKKMTEFLLNEELIAATVRFIEQQRAGQDPTEQIGKMAQRAMESFTQTADSRMQQADYTTEGRLVNLFFGKDGLLFQLLETLCRVLEINKDKWMAYDAENSKNKHQEKEKTRFLPPVAPPPPRPH